MNNTITYSYGHTKESAQLVREALNKALKGDKQKYNLTVSIRKADSGYGGPRVNITTTDLSLDKQYEYIVNSADGQIGDGPGKLVSKPCSEFINGRPHYSARLVTPEPLQKLNDRINKVLNQFGRSNDDAMTDYFDNTSPLFYGVSYDK